MVGIDDTASLKLSLVERASGEVARFLDTPHPFFWLVTGLVLAVAVLALARRLTEPVRVKAAVLPPLIRVERAVDDALQELERVQDARMASVRLGLAGPDVTLSSPALYLSPFLMDTAALARVSASRALVLGPRFRDAHQGLVDAMRAYDRSADVTVSLDEALDRVSVLVDALARVVLELDERDLDAARQRVRTTTLHAIVAGIPDARTVRH